jgi:DNA-binding NtrC family response regulator
LAALLAHVWPGNLRELRNRVSRGGLLATRPPIIREATLPNQPSAVQAPPPIALSAECHAAERKHVRRVVLQCGGRIGEGARILAFSRATLRQRLRRLGLANMEEE